MAKTKKAVSVPAKPKTDKKEQIRKVLKRLMDRAYYSTPREGYNPATFEELVDALDAIK